MVKSRASRRVSDDRDSLPRDNGRTEVQTLRLLLLVRVCEVTIDLADQDSPVSVSNPFSNRHEVDPAHNAVADEMMAHIVERLPGQLRIVLCGVLPNQFQ